MAESFEKNAEIVALDSSIFEKLEGLTAKLESGQEKEKFEDLLIDVKREAFNYIEGVLDEILDPATVAEKLEREKNIDPASLPRHGEYVTLMFALLRQKLNQIGIKTGWSDEAKKDVFRIQRAALDYAFRSALNYDELVSKKGLSPEEALEQMHLKRVVEPDYLNDRILNKFRQLPERARENLFEFKY